MDDANQEQAGKVVPIRDEEDAQWPEPYEPEYEDFDSGKVFQYLASINNEYQQSMMANRMSKIAQNVGFKRFLPLFNQFKRNEKNESDPRLLEALQDYSTDNRLTLDDGTELFLGPWVIKEHGVYKITDQGFKVTACDHPIFPTKRIVSMHTGDISYTLTFRKSSRRQPEEINISAADMKSSTGIVRVLGSKDISVSDGERARNLVAFLRDVTQFNYDALQEVSSASRLGWNKTGFAPYVDGIEFDGAKAFEATYNALKEVGNFATWKAEAIRDRAYSTTAHIVLAASFAAPLIEPLGVLSFFVHLWSAESGTGKTVAQMLGASVWGDPTAGGPFFPTFRATSVGLEMIAGFLHSIPVFLDELQLARDRQGNVNVNVYELASGSGKLRSNKQLGLNEAPTWSTTFITSGETPIVKATDGEGAINRVFEIECKSKQKVVEDGHKTANLLKENYGHAGRRFVERLLADSQIKNVKAIYEQNYQDCVNENTTEKQAMAAAVLLTADQLATEWIFQDDNALTLAKIRDFLKAKETVSILDRGYEILCDWVSINAGKLRGLAAESTSECYGLIVDGYAYIIKTVFSDVCHQYQLDESAMLSHLKSHGLLKLRADGRGYTVSHSIGSGQKPNCVGLLIPTDAETGELGRLPDDTPVPFSDA